MASAGALGPSELLGPELLCKSGDKLTTVNTVAALQGKFVAFYFSAHWCPPCRAFTPVLKKFYLNFVSKGKPLEIVFVSSDNSPAEFEDYYRGMPWLAVPFAKSDLRSSLSRRFKVLGIPTLVILDPNGQVVNQNARSALIRDEAGAKFPWPGEEDSSMGGGWMPFIVLFILGLVYWMFFTNKA